MANCTRKITMSRHKRCFCDGKLAKNSRCGIKRKSSSKKSSSAGACKPGTTKKYKGKCGCKTKGGGFKFVSKSKCGGSSKSMGSCKSGTTKKYKGKCGCKTKGGGFKFVKKSACKR